MTEPSETQPAAAGSESMPAPGRWTRRSLAIAGAIVVGFAVLISLLLFVAPGYIARFVADRYLGGLQINVEGVKTIEISLLRGEVSVGPVRFHSGTTDPGTIGQIGIKMSLRSLLEKQALLERVLIKDVDVAIRQTADGEILINGISLRQILAEETQEAQAKQAAGKSAWGAGIDDLGVRNARIAFINRFGGSAHFDVQHLDLRGFRTWEPDQPGTFVLSGDVNGVEVNAFGTARPFAEKVTATTEIGIDGIDLKSIEQYVGPLDLQRANGTLTLYVRTSSSLFPEGRLEGTADATFVLANIDTARADIGEIKLDQAGLTADGSFLVTSGGEISFTGKGETKLNQPNVRRPDGLAVQMENATLSLADLAVSSPGGGAVAISAHPRLELLAPVIGGPAELRSERVLIEVPHFDLARDTAGGISLKLAAAEDAAAPTVGHLELSKLAMRAPAAFSVDDLRVDLASLDLSTSPERKAMLKATANMEAANGAVAGAAAGNGPPTLAFRRLTSKLSTVELTAEAQRRQLSGAVQVRTDGLDVAILPPAREGSRPPGEPQRLAADAFELALSSLTVQSAGGTSSIAAKGEGSAERLAMTLPARADQPAADVSAGSLNIGIDDLNVTTGAAGEMRAAASLNTTLSTVAGNWGPSPPAVPAGRTSRSAPAQPAAAGGKFALDSLKLSAAPLRVGVEPARTSLGGGASIEASGLQARVPTDAAAAPFNVSATRLKVSAAELDGAVAAAGTNLTARIDVAADGAKATQPAPPVAGRRGENRTRFTVDSTRASFTPLTMRSQQERLTLAGTGSTQVSGIALELPQTAQNPTATATIGTVRTDITEIAFDGSGGRAAWNVGVNVLADHLASDVNGGELASFKTSGVTLGDLRVSSRRQVAIERVVIDQLQALLTRAYLFASATQERSRPKEAVEAVQDAAEEGWRIRIDRLGVGSGTSIRFRDDSVQPAATATVDIKSLQVLDLNTGDPAQRTQLRLDAAINQFTDLSVAGWAAPFGKQPDFDITGRLHQLELPPFSPYAAQAVGLNVESGRLSVDVTAAAKAGDLNGLVELTLGNLDFSTLSPADAQRLSASVGMPIETVVGLLQDGQGRIQLRLPVSGNLQSPSFDLTDAIRQALSGAVQAAVLAPFQLAFAPVALIAGAAKGSGGGPSLKDIPFPPGESELASTGEDMVAGLARVLTDRNRLRLLVCGRATALDLPAVAGKPLPQGDAERQQMIDTLRGDLEALATARTAAVRRGLIERGAKQDQVGECRSGFDAKDTGSPRADISL